MFRRRRGEGQLRRKGELVTRLASADSGLYFDARIAYGWTLTSENAAVLHGDEVARTLVHAAASAVCERCPLLQPHDAQDAVNARLSREIRSDERLVISGRAQVIVPDEVVILARRREQAAHEQRVAEAAETARLELLRERLLDRRLGPVWWIDRFADLQFATGDPAAKTKSVLAAFDLLSAALQHEEVRSAGAEGEVAVLRARVDELLCALEDPSTRDRAGGLLEAVVTMLVKDGRAEAVPTTEWEGAPGAV